MPVTGPLADERGRLGELLHIAWLLRRPAGPHVLAALRAGLPELTSLAEQPRIRQLLAAAAAEGASLTQVRSELGSLPGGAV